MTTDCDFCGAPVGYPPAGPCPNHTTGPNTDEYKRWADIDPNAEEEA